MSSGKLKFLLVAAALGVVIAGVWVGADSSRAHASEVTLPNVSYDPTRELFNEVNKAFAGTRKLARADLEFLYGEQGQELGAKHYYRPRLEKVAQKYAGQFPQLKLVNIDRHFGGWQQAQKAHFSDGGTFDQIYQANGKSKS